MSPQAGADTDLVRACLRQPVSHTPVWFMRQAGRSLPEYRAARGDGSILSAIADAELAAELTLQPVRRYGVDAAILFSDIVVPIHAIGFGVDIEPGRGPVVAQPFRDPADLKRLRTLDPEADVPYVAEAARLVARELAGSGVALIGFAGAPFTVASYLVEGGPSRTFAKVKALMHTDPALWDQLMERLGALAVASLRAQIEAGAQAVQLFDSWAGALSPAEYDRFALPATRRVLQGVADLGVPSILFGVGTGELLGAMGTAGADVVGVDWRVPLDEARRRVGGCAVQGNLDPALCGAPWPVVADAARDVLARGADGTGTGHIFNLGHGVLPEDRCRRSGRRRRPGPCRERDRMNSPVGVLVMAHGTPRTTEEIAPFYTRIRRGRAPSAEQLAELEGRYRSIGGLSPLTERTQGQVAALRAALEARQPGRFEVAYGAKHADPLIEDAAARLVASGADPLIGLVLTPHGSTMGSDEYLARARTIAAEAGRDFRAVPPWFAAPAFVEALAARVTDALDALAAQGSTRPVVVFTAHSLPERIRQAGDTYPEQLEASAKLVADAAGLARWQVAWQSAGRTPEPWLGPDVRDVLADLGVQPDVDGVVLCPIGFVADHLEVLYDLDVEAAAVAASCGLAFARTASLNDDPRLIAALADAVEAVAP